MFIVPCVDIGLVVGLWRSY